MKILFGVLIAAVLYVGYMMFVRPTPNEIVRMPSPILKQISQPIEIFDNEVEEISQQLHTTLQKVDFRGGIFGLGMAAPQLGSPWRIIAIKESYGTYKTMVNPKIVEKKWPVPWIESCFSTEGMHLVKRHAWIKVAYQNTEGKQLEETFWGFPSIVEQEIDHLNGVLITDN